MQILESESREQQNRVDILSNDLRILRVDKARATLKLASIKSAITYLRTARWLRRLCDRSIVWRPGGALLLGAVGVAISVVSEIPTFPCVCFSIAWSIICALLFFVPHDGQAIDLQLDLLDKRESVTLERRRIANLIRRQRVEYNESRQILAAIRNRIAEARCRESKERRLRALLDVNWKALRSIEFEAFLEEVFKELGYVVELTKTSGDQGVDLIVSHDGKRVAIQVKGYFNSVSNGAVQEAYAGMAFYKCCGCAVITNSRFTSSAVDLAREIGCVLVDEVLLPQMVLGKFDLFARCFQG